MTDSTASARPKITAEVAREFLGIGKPSAKHYIAVEEVLCSDHPPSKDNPETIVPLPNNAPVPINPVPSPSPPISATPSCPQLQDNPAPAVAQTEFPRRRTKENVNWCSRQEIRANLNLFDGLQQGQFLSLVNKQDNYPTGFNKAYFDNGYPILASGYSGAADYVGCMSGKIGNQRPCDQWHLCSHCAWFFAGKKVKLLTPLFNKSTFFHLTISFDGGLPLDTTNCLALQPYWLAAEAVIRWALSEHMINGAYMTHELSIRQFLPLTVVPHTHVLIAADSLEDEDEELIYQNVIASQDLDLAPSLKLKAKDTESKYRETIIYLTKAVELPKEYLRALETHGADRLVDLNLEMKTFLDGYSGAISHFPRMISVGCLDPRNKTFLGCGKKKKKQPKAKKEPKVPDPVPARIRRSRPTSI